MQKQQKFHYSSPQTLALWVAIATFGLLSPANAVSIGDSSHTNLVEASSTAAIPIDSLPEADLEGLLEEDIDQLLSPAETIPAQATVAPGKPSPSVAALKLATTLADIDSPEKVVLGSLDTNAIALDANLKPELVNQAPTVLAQVDNEPRVLVAEIQINGVEDSIELEQEILQAIETRAGRPTTVSQIRNDVNRIYATGLFADVLATPEDSALGVRVTFDVVPNPVLTSVVVQSLPLDDSLSITPPEVIDNIFRDGYGEIINLNDFQEGSRKFDQLQEWFQNNGYDLAKVIGIDEPSADGVITLVVVEGVIESIQVNFIDQDNQPVDGKTRDFIITREMELKPGDVFRRNVAQRDLQRIFGLGLFEDVQLDFTTGIEDPTKAVLNLNVIEANTGSIAAGGGISSASGFFGSVSYQQENLGGNNQNLGAEFQLGTRDALFDLSFSDPWIAGDSYRTSYRVNAFRRRSLSLIFDGGDTSIGLADSGDRPRINRIGGGVNFSRPLSKDVFSPAEWRGSLGFSYNRVRITNSDGETEFVDEAGNRVSFSDNGIDDLFELSMSLVRDKRRAIDGATRGSFTRLGTDQTIPIGNGSILFNRLRASHSIYLDSPIKLPSLGREEKPHTLALNIQGGTILGDLPPYEAFSLGGSNSVRGFEEGDVGSGRSYLQATAEYRFPIFSAIGGAFFADYATDLGSGSSVPGDPAGTRGKTGNGFGYGIGVRIDSPLGPIRIDYGLADGGNRVHFGIGERF